MTLNRRPSTRPTRPYQKRNGPPGWLIFILGVAFVMGGYYVWLGVSNFIESAGQGIRETTQQAIIINTATAERVTLQAESVQVNRLPSSTPIPDCMEFIVVVDRANLRGGPNINAEFIDTVDQNAALCVLGVEGDWYLIDQNPATRRIETAYIREDLVEAINPTPTPSQTFTPAPTVTAAPTNTPSITPSPQPTRTPDPASTPTRTPTPTATPTSPVISA